MSGNDNSKRSIGQIISDATDEELKDYHKESAGNMTPDRLKAMAARTEKRKRRHMRELAGVAALFILVVVGGIMVFNTFTADVDADKNAKEEIVTEDGVVIEDGGWSGESENNWEITSWDEVESIKKIFPQVIIPEYIPNEYEFERELINEEGNIITVDYLFLDGSGEELIIQQYIQGENLNTTQIYDTDRQLESNKGTIYINETENNNNAIIQMDDDIVIYIWTILSDQEIVKLVESMDY